ncbi:MAG: NPCBM/NEW2 domain-containing protein [Phycisphaerae bacterium]|jgi:hypothetical protein|nr:NPCBM/NEW2 domain-containing protein [Phycisphaerae bacterium]
MRNLTAAIFLGLVSVAMVSAQPTTKPATPQVRAETVDARVSVGRLVALSDVEVTLKTEKGVEKTALLDLAEMTSATPGNPLTVVGRQIVKTAAGGHVTASALTVADGKVHFTNPSLGKITFAFSRVAAMYLPPSNQSAADVLSKCASLEIEPGDQDVVVVAQKSGGWLGIEGIVKSIDDKMLTFSWKGADRKIGLPSIRAIFLAPTGSPKAEKFKGVLTLRDGSSVRFASLTYSKGAFSVSMVGSGETKIAEGDMAAVKFVSDRVVNLSDLKPQAVKQHGLLDTAMAWRANRSVSGGAILLGGRSFSTGLGLHSFCELTYNLDAEYKSLIAIVGIDDVIRPGGDANVTFVGDGKEILAPLRITGKGKPQAVRVSLAGVKTFIIRVDYGKDLLDVGDHVDLAGARLIK